MNLRYLGDIRIPLALRQEELEGGEVRRLELEAAGGQRRVV